MMILRAPLLLIATCGAALAADGWSNLFNGKDLNGWIQRGGVAKYAVEDGCIVGTSTLNTPNSFLCTGRDYGDFVLEYEFKVDPRLNSGVQIRSHSLTAPGSFVWDGKQIVIPAERVHGYQIEIDPNPKQDRWWSGGIYDESRRGWLYPGVLGGDPKAFTDQGRALFKQGDWNKVRVEAIGDSIKTTLNGTPCASIRDGVTESGFIALQVHGINKEADKDGSQVRWRNLRIQEVDAAPQNVLTDAEKAEGWALLWDGKTNAGWRSARGPEFPKEGWAMEGGVLVVGETGGAESAAAGDIITKNKFSDFELSVDFKITPGANSGIKIFVDPDMNKGEGSAIGPEFQILDDEIHPDAKLGRDGNRTIGSLYDLIRAPKNKRIYPVGAWSHARILSEGMHVTFWLNGVKTVEFDRKSDEWRKAVAGSKYSKWSAFGELDEGHILLQDHGNQVSYRNVKIRDFSKK
ncbi:MAG: DUF1080 domain-containing protein [Akkermansiaceae bacterium]|nr:DUF1080 domain-containing protein [Akkermansiaceae bacterium]